MNNIYTLDELHQLAVLGIVDMLKVINRDQPVSQVTLTTIDVNDLRVDYGVDEDNIEATASLLAHNYLENPNFTCIFHGFKQDGSPFPATKLSMDALLTFEYYAA